MAPGLAHTLCTLLTLLTLCTLLTHNENITVLNLIAFFFLQGTTLRNRFYETSPQWDYFDNKYEKSKYPRPMPYVYFLGILGLMLVVFSLVIIIEKQLPTGYKLQDEAKYPDSFIAERAYNILKNLTEIGPRIAGSYENEVLAINVLKQEIDAIIKEAHETHIIEVDIQKASGAFNLEFLDGMTNVYQDVQNVVVKVGSRINSPHSLLINCHFDSVVDSPGEFFCLLFLSVILDSVNDTFGNV